MNKKRRMFDIDFEEPVPAGTQPATAAPPPSEGRRGPMAAAIVENADALGARQQAEAAIREENDALAHELVRLRKAGLITAAIPLDAIRTDKLVRDRSPGRDVDIDELKLSIRELGLSNPIRVEAQGDGYELVQGFRRVTAFRELLAETGDAAFGLIPAALVPRGESQLRLYRQMVDENLVRRGVTFGELAQLAIGYAEVEPDVDGPDHAVDLLFASSGRQKRAYIKGFARLLARLAPHLRHPEAMPRAVGLDVLKRLEADPHSADHLVRQLQMHPDRDGAGEVALLRAFLSKRAEPVSKPVPLKTARTTFRISRPEGAAKCTASDGRVELRQDRDFSAVERQRLERAVAAFFAALED